jgi:hypothetical protein
MKKLVFTLASIALLASCGKDKDKTAPEFGQIVSPLGQGNEGVILLRGEHVQVIQENENTLEIKGTVTDETELKELKIDIHNASDGHSHKISATYEFLDFEKIIDLSGKTAYNFDVDIDLSSYDNLISGLYDVTIYATDKAGNQTTFGNGKAVKRQVYIKRDYQPTIIHANDNTVEEKTITVKQNNKLSIDGYIEENRGGTSNSVSFIRIQVLSGGTSVFDKFWGTSEYFRVGGVKLTGATIPAFEDDELLFDDILNSLGNDNFTAQLIHNNHTIRVTVEDNKKNFTVREFTLNVEQTLTVVF